MNDDNEELKTSAFVYIKYGNESSNHSSVDKLQNNKFNLPKQNHSILIIIFVYYYDSRLNSFCLDGAEKSQMRERDILSESIILNHNIHWQQYCFQIKLIHSLHFFEKINIPIKHIKLISKRNPSLY